MLIKPLYFRTVYIAGLGRAIPEATYLHYTFVKMGIQAVLLDAIASTVADKARLIRRDEALVVNQRDLDLICIGRAGVDLYGQQVKTDPDRLTALVILGIQDEEHFPLIFYRENCADMALRENDVQPEFTAV